ncbi:MAG: nucleotidyltransferase family protein [Vicinamibacterales bacterium]
MFLAWAALREERLDPAPRRRLERIVREAAIVDAWQGAAVTQCIAVLAAAGIPVLVMKGAALSWTCYPEAHVRPRNDDDLLVPRERFDAAVGALCAAGYRVEPQIEAEPVSRQRHLSREWPAGVHHVDLHWWPSNPVAFDALPAFEALMAGSVPLPACGPAARAPGTVHMLLLLCAHRVAHHTPTEDPQWLLDLHFAAVRLGQGEWARFAAAARASRISQICGTELASARARLGTPVPADVLADLLAARGEPSADHLRDRGPLYVQWLNLRHLSGPGARLALISAHLLPPAAYMQARFGPAGPLRLSWLYLRRLCAGSARWVREYIGRGGPRR